MNSNKDLYAYIYIYIYIYTHNKFVKCHCKVVKINFSKPLAVHT